jgi:hypothetical protein
VLLLDGSWGFHSRETSSMSDFISFDVMEVTCFVTVTIY